jgi:demethylmenaquinone methyltransferase/2-methoxy-6-polyprenyl-1,4-benzoquinol methylase
MDARWKRELLDWVTNDKERRSLDVLDVACGTGDLAIAVALRLPTARVTGIDVSTRMLELARERVSPELGSRLTFSFGDLAHLSAASASVDVVTGGYAVRNAPDPRQAVAELARVLRSGGRLYILDFFLPRSRLWRSLYLGYLRAAGVLVGWLWHRKPATYEYIAASIEHFVTLNEFVAWLSAAGLSVERTSAKLAGGVALVSAVRR